MLYLLHELQHVLSTPLRLQAELTRMTLENPFNPLSYTQLGRNICANAEMIERLTKRFGRPEFGLHQTTIGGRTVEVTEEVIVEKP